MVQRLADRLSTRWSKPYSEVMGWLQTRLSFVFSTVIFLFFYCNCILIV